MEYFPGIPRLRLAAEIGEPNNIGRTKPLLFTCSDENAIAGEYWVKFKHGNECYPEKLAFELYANLLGKYLGIKVPDAATIEIKNEDVLFFEHSRNIERLRSNIGLNFGSKAIADPKTMYLPEQTLSKQEVQKAFEVFVFDALLQNPDRTSSNQNLFLRKDEIVVFDHESAFSFVYAFAVHPAPWNVYELKFLKEHVFYSVLRDKCRSGNFVLDESGIGDKIAVIPKIELCASIENVIPDEWAFSKAQQIKNHIESVCANVDKFIAAIKKFLMQ